MKFFSVFKNKETEHQWQWPLCKKPKTHSFRGEEKKTLKKLKTDYFETETQESRWFTNSSSESASFSSDSDDYEGQTVEMVVRGILRSERLFFEEGETKSILEKAKGGNFPYKQSLALAMESKNPYIDFRRSMEEMVETHGIINWECLEELLDWYLKVNGKSNHGFIVKAFVDMLIDLAAAASSDGGGNGGVGGGFYDFSSLTPAESCFASSPLCFVE